MFRVQTVQFCTIFRQIGPSLVLLLGLFLFLILINAAGFDHLQHHLGEQLTKPLNKRSPLSNTHLKYIDDMTLAEAINLKRALIPNPDPCPPQPLAYHDRTQHIFPEGDCQLQEQLNKLLEYCEQNEMLINGNKSKVMIFNTGRKYDFMPKLHINDESYLDVVEDFKLLGVKIRSDMKWYDNSDYICKKGYERLWMIRRLKGLGASTDEMLDVYFKQIRSVLELAVPVWQPGLTRQEEKQIERVQKTAFYVILGEQYQNYQNSLEVLLAERLSDRRYTLCLNFAKKALKNPKYKSWFSESTDDPKPKPNTRGAKTKHFTKLKPVEARTGRYANSPIPYLTGLLNDNCSN